MFHFPSFPPHCLCVQQRVTAHDDCRVSPFGNPRIKALVDSSPGTIVASHVLHRFLVPRHPPCALKNLATDARVHCAVLKQRPATHHPTLTGRVHWGRHREGTTSRPYPQIPNSVPGTTRPALTFHAEAVLTRISDQPCRIINVPPMSNHRRTFADVVASGFLAKRSRVLLRKEVIQPHLPVRLPCYDFVPIASPTFDSSLPQGVGPPASGVTDFRDVTGGVYKARERIHRSNADLRLLATPTSWGRVADPNPN